jgi:hypothetical protein
MPTLVENELSTNFFLPEFMQRFLPDRETLAPFLDSRDFSRVKADPKKFTFSVSSYMKSPFVLVGWASVPAPPGAFHASLCS